MNEAEKVIGRLVEEKRQQSDLILSLQKENEWLRGRNFRQQVEIQQLQEDVRGWQRKVQRKEEVK